LPTPPNGSLGLARFVERLRFKMPLFTRAASRSKRASLAVNTAFAKPYGEASSTATASSSESITSTHRSGPNTSTSV
jgi:hypothetical protein